MQKQCEKIAWEKSNDAYSLSIRVQITINHISICFYDKINVKENVLIQSASWKRHYSVVWTLIENGKLANQITRLATNCGKKFLAHSFSTARKTFVKKAESFSFALWSSSSIQLWIKTAFHGLKKNAQFSYMTCREWINFERLNSPLMPPFVA